MLWNPNKRATIRQEIMRHGADYTGQRGHGGDRLAVAAPLRGVVVIEDGKVVGAKGAGPFLRRDPSPHARPHGGWEGPARGGVERKEWT